MAKLKKKKKASTENQTEPAKGRNKDRRKIHAIPSTFLLQGAAPRVQESFVPWPNDFISDFLPLFYFLPKPILGSRNPSVFRELKYQSLRMSTTEK